MSSHPVLPRILKMFELQHQNKHDATTIIQAMVTFKIEEIMVGVGRKKADETRCVRRRVAQSGSPKLLNWGSHFDPPFPVFSPPLNFDYIAPRYLVGSSTTDEDPEDSPLGNQKLLFLYSLPKRGRENRSSDAVSICSGRFHPPS
jgi:hypothetical protein